MGLLDALGAFERAESDAIAYRGGTDPYRFWDGIPFTGKRVILRCLHGLCDTIQFIRYAPLLRKEASRLETFPIYPSQCLQKSEAPIAKALA
jgi:hypothetical protein